MTMKSLDEQVGLDTSDHTTPGFRSHGDSAPGIMPASTNAKKTSSLADIDFGSNVTLAPSQWMSMVQSAESQGKTYFQTAVRPMWARNYRAYRSQHMGESKYMSRGYKGRSKLFRPKTRDAVRKKMQSAAQALFATADVVSVTAQNEGDDMQAAAAALKQEVLNYRLSRESRRNGLRWFTTAMGAVQTANIAGIVASKQSWRFKELEGKKGKTVILEDRPAIDLIPPENMIFDPNCDWVNPAQSAQFMRIAWPMSADDAYEFITSQAGPNQLLQFFEDIQLDQLRAAATSTGPEDTISSRTARNDGRDPMQLISGAFGRVWLYEWYLRWRGVDYTFWTLRTEKLLSKPVRVIDAYPEQHGERPVVIGYGSLEAFRATPTSPVESWQPLQLELNDQVNLRLDHLKQTVSPSAKVKRGAGVDLEAVQRRGADKIVLVNNMEDVEWPQIPDIPMSAAQQDAQINADFDSLAGVMNMGTVQTNRALNETVGGMSLLAGDSTSSAEFDLSVIVESWVDPVIHQVIRLEEMYESDATVLEIAGQKAKLWQKWGVNEITDHMLLTETDVTVKVGTGSANLPMQRLQKFQMASQIVGQLLAPYVQGHIIQPPIPNVKEIVETVFGAAGFSDGGDRFFLNLQPNMAAPPQQPGQDPHAMALQEKSQIDAQKLQLDLKKHQDGLAVKDRELQLKAQEINQRAQTTADQNRVKLMSDHIRAQAEVQAATLDRAHERGMQAAGHMQDMHNANMQAIRDLAARSMMMPQGGGMGADGAGGGGVPGPKERMGQAGPSGISFLPAPQSAPMSGMAPSASQMPLPQPTAQP